MRKRSEGNGPLSRAEGFAPANQRQVQPAVEITLGTIAQHFPNIAYTRGLLTIGEPTCTICLFDISEG